MENKTKLIDFKLINSSLSSNADLIDEINGRQPIAQRFGSKLSKFNSLLPINDDENTHLYSTAVQLEVDSAIVKDDEEPSEDLFENEPNLLFQITIEYRIVFELIDDSLDLENDEQIRAIQTDVMNQFQPYMRSALQNLTKDSYFDDETIPVRLF
ncbi:hypothetical protein [Weissella confusa]|uniref:hypothetical protein n=1 Tax=Weissella confusa TaxID=1583 RepID=UPI0022E365C3|nr:hypothetical protein [Weissella confusa]